MELTALAAKQSFAVHLRGVGVVVVVVGIEYEGKEEDKACNSDTLVEEEG